MKKLCITMLLTGLFIGCQTPLPDWVTSPVPLSTDPPAASTAKPTTGPATPPTAAPPPTSSPAVLSSEGDITDFSAGGTNEIVTINQAAKTVTATLDPLDLTQTPPAFKLSPGAVMTTPPKLEDGKAAGCIVTAEDGTQVNWSITVNLRYGIALTLAPKDSLILSAGYIHSTDKEIHVKLGAGRPIAIMSGDGHIDFYALTVPMDLGGSAIQEDPYININIDKTSPGRYTQENAVIAGSGLMIPGRLNSFTSFLPDPKDFQISLQTVDAPTGNVKGAISGTLVDKANPLNTLIIVKGFFKCLRLNEAI